MKLFARKHEVRENGQRNIKNTLYETSRLNAISRTMLLINNATNVS